MASPCTCEPGCDPKSYPRPSCPCDGHTVWRVFHHRKDEVGGKVAA